MIKKFLFFRENIFLKRIYSIKNSIIAYSLASLIDIFIILKISSVFSFITSDNFEGSIIQSISITLILVLTRTIVVFTFKKYAFQEVFSKKLRDEILLVKNFIKLRVNQDVNNNEVKLFKEKIINSSNLAAINFDIPFFSIVAELIFAFGGVFILLKIFGIELLLFNLPLFIILIISSKYVSKKLKRLGTKILNYSEIRLNTIDNISEIAIELSALNYPNKLVDYFLKINSPFNKTLSKQTIISNMTQI